MKKFLLIFLLMVYAAAGSGTALSIHFCMGDYAGLSFARQKQSTCSKCGMSDKAGCCHDETRLLKLDIPATPVAKWMPIAATTLPLQHWQLQQPLSHVSLQTFSISQSSRLKDPGPPIYIHQCHFRI